MLILRVKKTNIFDVFFGDGWNSHARVLLEKTGHIKQLSGVHLTKINFIAIAKTAQEIKNG